PPPSAHHSARALHDALPISRIAPVVLLTAFSQKELVERARDAGAMAYVVKPFSSNDLLPALEIALSRHAEITALESEISDLTDRSEEHTSELQSRENLVCRP